MTALNERIVEALETIGPMSANELAEHLRVSHNHVTNSLLRLRKSPRRVRVGSWVRDAYQSRGYLRACYHIGTGHDAPKPDAKKVTGAQHRKIVKLRYANSSIFRLAESTRP